MIPRQAGEPWPRPDVDFRRRYYNTRHAERAFNLSAAAWPTADEITDSVAVLAMSPRPAPASYAGLATLRRRPRWLS